MFEESNIQELKDRLGWSEYENPVYANKLDSDSKKKDSGLTFNSFHKLVTVENVYYCQPNKDISDSDLNAYLNEILDNTIRSILNYVFVSDSRAIKGTDNTAIISAMCDSGVFDECIGYCHAVKVLELLTASTRSNRIETITGHNYALLMSELKGASTKDGVLVAKGILSYCEDSRKALADYHYGYSGTFICDATNEW